MLDAQVAEIGKATGGSRALTRPEGNATKEIVETAKEQGASLIVAGRRGLRGIKALGSVSERVVSGAECSVLLVPGDGDEARRRKKGPVRGPCVSEDVPPSEVISPGSSVLRINKHSVAEMFRPCIGPCRGIL